MIAAVFSAVVPELATPLTITLSWGSKVAAP